MFVVAKRLDGLRCHLVWRLASAQATVFDGDPAPTRTMAQPRTQILAHVYCGQTAGWIRMLLGTEVNLGPGDVVLDGVAAPPSPSPVKGAQPPVFGPCPLWPNGWMDEDATWYGNRPQPRPHYVRRGPGSLPRKGHSSPPFFGPCLLWPQLPVSATAELLYKWSPKKT